MRGERYVFKREQELHQGPGQEHLSGRVMGVQSALAATSPNQEAPIPSPVLRRFKYIF